MVINEFDQEKRDLIKESLLPEVEIAYTTIRLDRDRRYVIRPTKKKVEPLGGSPTAEIGLGFLARHRSEDAIAAGSGYTAKLQLSTGKGRLSRGGSVGRKTMWRNHCGKIYHSKFECFQLICFPDGCRSQQREGLDAGNEVTVANSRDRVGKGTKGTGAATAVIRDFVNLETTRATFGKGIGAAKN